MELICKVQKYAWGKRGISSLVAKLQATSNENFTVEEDVPYAELWMGTHLNGPSSLRETGETLESVIKANPQYLGDNVVKNFGPQLPYLFKVLSVNTALSVQAHPNKKHAEDLHSKFPDIYKDPNHKPELAIALTPFEALCGFRLIQDIKNFIRDIPELNNIIGKDILSHYEETADDEALLKQAFRAVLTNKAKLQIEFGNLLERFRELDSSERERLHADLFERLNKDYPNDPGCLMIYFLNYIKLKPGEAIFLAANDPHAYIFGDCIECMACSDNVVRAGLTPKYVDVETLCSMLTYKGEKPLDKLFKSSPDDIYSNVFRPPVPDFALAEIKIPCGIKEYKLKVKSSGSILLVTNGEGKTGNTFLKPGIVIFIPANEMIEIKDVSQDLQMYQAFANV